MAGVGDAFETKILLAKDGGGERRRWLEKDVGRRGHFREVDELQGAPREKRAFGSQGWGLFFPPGGEAGSKAGGRTVKELPLQGACCCLCGVRGCWDWGWLGRRLGMACVSSRTLRTEAPTAPGGAFTSVSRHIQASISGGYNRPPDQTWQGCTFPPPPLQSSSSR